jgi:PTS system mannose-specific IID component
MNRGVLARVFLRSLWLQGLWTVQRGQNLGCLYSLWPVVDGLYDRPEDRAEVARTHAGFFSTHPYTAGVVLGVVAGLETDRARGNGPSGEAIAAARSAMAGPLAALGEAFFWSLWRPLSFLAAMALAWAHPGRPGRIVLSFLVIYNLLHLGARWQGLGGTFSHRECMVYSQLLLAHQPCCGCAAADGSGGGHFIYTIT